MTTATTKRSETATIERAKIVRRREVAEDEGKSRPRFAWDRALGGFAEGEPHLLFGRSGFLHRVWTNQGDSWPTLKTLPDGRRQRALRRATGLTDAVMMRMTGIPGGALNAIETGHGTYTEEAVGAEVLGNLHRLFGAMESWVKYAGLEVVIEPTEDELEAQRLAELEAARAADDLHDLRQVASAGFDDTHGEWVEVRATFKGGWSNDNKKRTEFVKTFTPAQVLALLDRIPARPVES